MSGPSDVLPAYAGMILRTQRPRTVRRRAPRVCGDDPHEVKETPRRFTVLPAYAGMILISKLDKNGKKGAPRVCGDDPLADVHIEAPRWCSPRMRG